MLFIKYNYGERKKTKKYKKKILKKCHNRIEKKCN